MESVIFSITRIPTIPKVEKRFCNDSTPEVIESSCIFLDALLILSKPLAALSKFKLFFNLSIVFILVLTLASNRLLSNSIDTTFSSIFLLIIWQPPSMHHPQFYQK